MDFPLMGVVLQEEASLTGMVLREEDSLTGMVLGEEALVRLEVATVLREEEDILEEEGAAVMIQINLEALVISFQRVAAQSQPALPVKR